ncbi:MAG: putative transcriptional regulator of viral defense system [Flavobacteriales bacterium]
MCWNITEMRIRKEIKPYTHAPIPHHVVMEILEDYARPNDKISELIKKGELIALKRGLYIPGAELDLPVPHDYLIANHLRGPSYVSAETALWYWGLIPERVHEITSITLHTSKTYQTPVGRFSFRHLASPYYSFGIQRIELAPLQMALIATKEKALCDKIITTSGINLRSISNTQDFLLSDLRIEAEDLKTLDLALIASWIPNAPKNSSLKMLIKTIDKL